MDLTLLAFASARDAFGFSSRSVEANPSESALDVVRRIAPHVDISNLRVALDCEFVTWQTPVGQARELAFIPPVSGG